MSNALETSFEFFPPRTPVGQEKLASLCDRLVAYDPSFFSVTYGAGASVRERTLDAVLRARRGDIDAAPHLSCIGSDRENLAELLAVYRREGVRRIVALRGDVPSGEISVGEFRYANELIEFIREETGDAFELIAAAYPEMHPQAPNYETDLRYFVNKMHAGADKAITQYFYDAEAYFHFVEKAQAQGVDKPIIPGIMPIVDADKLRRFSATCGASIPRWIDKQLEAYAQDPHSLQAFGQEVVSRLCERLIAGGAPGLHFYTLNQAAPTLAVLNNLNLSHA